MNEEPFIAVENLSKHYRDVPAVSDVSFTLAAGQILALLGPNGAGKTTTIKMILGLVTPTSGQAMVMAYDMAVAGEMRQGLHHVGAVLEGARNAYWRLSVMNNLRYFGGLRGLAGRTIQERADELLAMLDLSAHKDREVRLLSRGMQQKVAIANALIHDPEILVLDEPTLGLDVEAAKTLEETIVRLAKQGRAILLTTHVMSLAERLAHHIFVIHEGQQVAYDDTKTLLNQFDTRNIVEVKLKEPLAPETWQQVSQRFPSLVNHGPMLEWVEPEQADVVALHQMLHQRAATVLSINRREPTLEEVFLSLTRRAKQANGSNA